MDGTTPWKDLPIVLIRGTTSWKDLPTVVTMDILCRLPVKTLIRSTSVSKSWYALIRNPKFISEHINRSISHANKNGEHYVLMTPSTPSPQNPCSVISDETFAVHSKLEVPFRTESETIKIIGSINGLVCATDESPYHHGRAVYLWNPSLRKHKTLVSSCFASRLRGLSGVSLGFGFHAPTNDYRVVRIVFCVDTDCNLLGKLDPKVEVYSLKRDSWKRVVGATVPPRVASTHNTAFINGAIYWLGIAPEKYNDADRWILSYELEGQKFRDVKLPDKYQVGAGKNAYVSLMEFKGSLALCLTSQTKDYGGSMLFSGWVMREDVGGAISWTKQFKVVLQGNYGGLPLKFTKGGKLIMEVLDRSLRPTKLVLYNLENLQFKKLGDDGPYTADAAFMESLVLLDGGKELFRNAKKSGAWSKGSFRAAI